MSLAPATTAVPGNDPTLPVWRAGSHEARPFYFGHRGRPLFGWLHPSPEGTVGLLICYPFGDPQPGVAGVHRADGQYGGA